VSGEGDADPGWKLIARSSPVRATIRGCPSPSRSARIADQSGTIARPTGTRQDEQAGAHRAKQ